MPSNGDSEEAIAAERPRKKSRLNTVDVAPTRKQLLLQEVDLEIALRKRLETTIKSRLTWALLLQEQVSAGLNFSDGVAFQDASLGALEVAEASCNAIFSRPIRPFQRHVPSAPSQEGTSVSAATPAPQPLPSRARGQARYIRAPPKKLLFLRNNTTQPPQVVKLACPDCSRTDFSSLQGLLNHCRLRHDREFGSHDDCVQYCAVLVESDEQQSWVVANGAEVAGISLPGLRRLFEIAVGGGRVVLPLPAPNTTIKPAEPQLPGSESMSVSMAMATVDPPIANITQTLGHHEDTPALAPFLGREPRRRHINTYDIDEPVDVLGFPGATRNWHSRYAERSRAITNTLPSLTETQPSPSNNIRALAPIEETDLHTKLAFHSTIGSRFHIVARVAVEDYSLWIPPDKRSPDAPSLTHRWRLAISSPSYSLPLGSFLDKIIISCGVGEAPAALVSPITLEEPPFVFTSTADRPFLARLKFLWASPDENVSTIVDHWVELDSTHLSTPACGDQQVFDVELGRDTTFFTNREDTKTINWDDFAHTTNVTDSAIIAVAKSEIMTNYDDEVDQRLRKLLIHFPMTLKDVKGRLIVQMPYHLTATPTDFMNLVHGRRKAVEWGRARALLEAYEESHTEETDQAQDATGRVVLTVSDVYRWLETGGHFPRAAKPQDHPLVRSRKARGQPPRTATPSRLDHYCHRCGLNSRQHPDQQLFQGHDSSITQGPRSAVAAKNEHTSCSTITTKPETIPSFDVMNMLTSTAPHNGDEPFRLDTRILPPDALLCVADPNLVMAVYGLMAAWKIPYINGGSLSSGHLVESPKLWSLTKSRIEETLAPSALLSLLIRPMTKLLLQGGLEVYRKDELALQRPGKSREATRGPAVKRLLTPSHILRWVQQPAFQETGLPRMVALIIGKIGVISSENDWMDPRGN